jgi:predicted small lipoprotein YifL
MEEKHMSTPNFTNRVVVIMLVATLLTACTGGISGPTSTPTIDPATPAAATAQAATQSAKATADAQATAEAQANATGTAKAQATLDAQATEQAGATATAISLLTATKVSALTTSTAAMAERQTKTAVALAQKTAQAQPMFDLVQRLFTDGYLTSTDGTYTHMEDFDESEAKINYIHWYPTGADPQNFVIRADMAWESASDKADWWNSGCGFIFHVSPDDAFYSAELDLDGYVRLGTHRAGFSYVEAMGQSFYGTLDKLKGNATFMMVVNNSDGILVFINEELVHRYKGVLKLARGDLYYSLTSGTNKGFGTRCQMTNVDLWELK